MTSEVYFVSNCRGLIKIGYSRSVSRRLRQFRTANPSGEFLLLGRTPGGAREENALHQELSAFRRQGEWFEECEQVHSVIDHAVKYGLAQVPRSEPPEMAADPISQSAIDAASLAFRLMPFIGEGDLSALSEVSGVAESLLWKMRYRPPAELTMGEWGSLLDGLPRALNAATATLAEIGRATAAVMAVRTSLQRRSIEAAKKQAAIDDAWARLSGDAA